MYLHLDASDAPDFVREVSRGAPLQRRRVRVPDWYRQRIVPRLRYSLQLLTQRATG